MISDTRPAMGRLTEPRTILARLEILCKRITSDGSANGWKSGCEAWQELMAALDGYRGTTQ
jgi:hypothetical protein